jgi:hypothetical protein
MIDDDRKKRRGDGSRRQNQVPDLRNHCVSSRFNDAELAALDERRGKMARGEYLRCALFGQIPNEIPTINREAWESLARASNNLNQIARKLNTDNIRPDIDIDAVNEALRNFRNTLIGVIYDGNGED